MPVQLPPDLDARVRTAVKHFWATRTAQASNQRRKGTTDQGARSAVTGGAQMDGFNSDIKPWLGYLFLLEDCPKSQSPVAVKEPHFEVFPEFKAASYARRYELLCPKLVRESLYSMAAFLLSEAKTGARGAYSEPAPDLAFSALVRSLAIHVAFHSP